MGAYAFLRHRVDPSGAQVVFGGDGASWISEPKLNETFHEARGVILQLVRFHVQKSIRQG